MPQRADRGSNRGELESLLEEARAAEREGDLDLALQRYECALACGAPETGDVQTADILRWIGTVRRMRDEMELAREAYAASLREAEDSGDRRRVASALNCLGILEQFGGSLDEADARYREGRVLAEEAGDDALVAMIDQNLGILANIHGDIELAISSYQSALDRLLFLQETGSAANVLNNLGMAYVDLSDWHAAASAFDRSYELADGLRDAGLLADIDLNRGELHLRQGKLAEARESCDRAFEGLSRIGSEAGRGEVQKLYGVIARESERPFLAESHLEQAFTLARSSGNRLLEAEVEAERARVFLDQERNAEALACLNRSHRLFRELDASRDLRDLDQRLDRLEETYLEVVAHWGDSIEAKDQYTAGHCERVAEYACMLAADMGYSGRDLTWFRMGGFLHDVGKTAVPAEVLNKPGKLTAEEWDQMKSHTAVGHRIVEELNFPWDVPPMVRSHHERWDGGGYPDGLSGEAIPLTARILCLADVYDALTTARSYRSALAHDEAMAIMERDNGKAFDPELFARFQSLIEARRARDRGAAATSRPLVGRQARATMQAG